MVAGHPGGFPGEAGPDTPGTHGREQWAKARALVASGPTPAHVLLDHTDVGKPQSAGLLGAGLWPPLTLGVGTDVMAGGLTARDGGITWAMAGVNLGPQGDPPRAGHWG